MSATISEELCPWHERRLPRELYVKFFVVNFIAIGNYANLLHLRRERRGLLPIMLMFTLPIAGSALLVIPLIAISIQVLVCKGDIGLLNIPLQFSSDENATKVMTEDH